MFEKILIANRGEIACRVIRTCRRLGIQTVAVYSEADANAQHVRQADCAYPIGGPRPQDSYLRGDAIIDVAKKSGAQAIHPGYGFLSENADFAEACAKAGIAFIGPSAESMRKMGSKAGAKDLMAAHGVPVVPGYTGADQDPALLAHEAQRIGFPLLIKAAYGGGGKGMRIVRKLEEFAANLESCQREAKNAFGRDRVLLERYIETPRHIEFQIFGDTHGNIVHLNERECSAQRRYQKVLEETPSPFLTPELRTKMGEAAIAAGRALGYANAGTVEFIVAPSGDFYFMEINTRLQVEHPVTEMTLHLDLVELQLRVAAGEALPASLIRNKAVPQDGHAIELRLYAEDPQAGFLPGSGKLQRLQLPNPDAHVRIDSGVIEGDTVSIFYDPMIAKLIVWDRTRADALTRMGEALARCDVIGPKSNIEFLERLVRHPAVVEGRIDTGYLDRNLDEFIGAETHAEPIAPFAAATAWLLHEEARTRNAATASSDPHSPWARADAFRLGHSGKRIVKLDQHEITAFGAAGNYELASGETKCAVAGARIDHGILSARFDGVSHRFALGIHGDRIVVHDGTRRRTFVSEPVFAFVPSEKMHADSVRAPMPGRIVVVKIKSGDKVEQGQELLVMEAMKMELSLKAPHAATIEFVGAKSGEFVEADVVLARFAETKQ
ncbi:MAG TPA: biotin carboxylase N-terminal domain-containing protein [Rudaea sp.]|nr:biotin carboxylase N-terminal domain-containing protein [Rudaea sp.]